MADSYVDASGVSVNVEDSNPLPPAPLSSFDVTRPPLLVRLTTVDCGDGVSSFSASSLTRRRRRRPIEFDEDDSGDGADGARWR